MSWKNIALGLTGISTLVNSGLAALYAFDGAMDQDDSDERKDFYALATAEATVAVISLLAFGAIYMVPSKKENNASTTQPADKTSRSWCGSVKSFFGCGAGSSSDSPAQQSAKDEANLGEKTPIVSTIDPETGYSAVSNSW